MQETAGMSHDEVSHGGEGPHIDGSKLQELERPTATKITIPKAQDSTDGAITVVGARDGIEKALFEIQKISDEQSKQAFEKLEVPKIYHPFVCGANNANIQAWTAKYSNVRINIPPLSVQKDELSITGEKDGVLAVKAAIVAIWKEMEKKCSTIQACTFSTISFIFIEERIDKYLAFSSCLRMFNTGGGEEIPAPLCDRPTRQRHQRDSRRDRRLRRDALQR